MSIENGAYLSPIQASSVVDSVVSRLVSAIMSGELKPGMKIPTEPDLVKAFGVGRSTIREAIRILVWNFRGTPRGWDICLQWIFP